jgi:ABC-type multidrug transport system fused ATPase/permease subunit
MMGDFRNIVSFAGPYLARYRGRLLGGLVFGVLFGLSNSLIIFAVNVLVTRLQPLAAQNISLAARIPGSIASWAAPLAETLEHSLDFWVPQFGQHLTLSQIVGGILILPILTMLRGGLGYLSNYCMGWVSQRVTADLRCDILDKLTSLSLEYFNKARMGDLTTRVKEDAMAVEATLGSGFADLVKEPVTILGIVVTLFLMDWKLALVGFLFLPLTVVPVSSLGRRMRRAATHAVASLVEQSNLLLESLAGIRVVKAFGLEKEQSRKFRDHSEAIVRHNMKIVQAREWINPIIETISSVGIGVLVVYVVWSGTALADVASFIMGMILVGGPLKKLARLHALIKQTGVAVDRLVAVQRVKSTIVEPSSPVPLPPFRSEIRFENVSFDYGETGVLHNIDLVIPRGRRLGIAGESGSGKSTMLNLLFRFYDPTGGKILLDGVCLRDAATRDLREHMALVSQDVVLFDMSAADNIACGRLGATREEVETAARAAFAHDFISALPQGYDTPLGDRGVRLSGGQRQRIAIARAFVRNAPILVLDEATAALDAHAEAEVQQAIDRLSESRTVVCVAHRLSTLAGCDEILVLRQGRIAERGPYPDLLKSNGEFAALARKQGIAS